jgi:hypothetical protein
MVAIPVMDAIKGKPGKGAFDNPAFWHNFAGRVGSFDDVADKAEQGLGPIDAARLGAAVDKDLCQREHHGQADQPKTDAARVGYSGAMHDGGQQKAQRIDGNMRLASLHPRATIKAALPPFGAVLTGRLSMIPTRGQGCCPAVTRAASRHAALIRDPRPFAIQRRQSPATCVQGGWSRGSNRHGQPVRNR